MSIVYNVAVSSTQAPYRILFVPGWRDSLAGHWQTLWQQQWDAAKVQQSDWEEPHPQEWVAGLDTAIGDYAPETIVVGHSLGVLTLVLWSAWTGKTVAGAFLVAPPDPLVDCPVISRFRAALNTALPFPALVAGSEDDPYARLPRVERMASQWGADCWNTGRSGHINIASGHGHWPEGIARFQDFSRQLQGMSRAAA